MIKETNILTIDLESWVHKIFSNDESKIKKIKDKNYICNSTLNILKILKNYNIQTTFFIIGEIFDWYPELINKIKEMGHEIGFHTYSHKILESKKCLKDELKLGKKFIDEFDIKGFRAPEVNIKKEHLYLLKDWGFTYDSSIYSEFKIFEPIEGLLEVPISTYPIYRNKKDIQYPRNLTIPLLLREIPFGSGYFIGLLGLNIQWFIKKINKKNIPVSLVMHPWQIIKPQIENMNFNINIINKLKMIPYNINRKNTFDFLCKNYKFIPIIELINKYGYNSENLNQRIKD